MEHDKQEFIEFMARAGVLTFGDFVTKAGRKTPFFVNTGRYDTGTLVDQLGVWYARALSVQLDLATVQGLFGPAYKGIPLVTTTAAALARNHGWTGFYCFDRKEAKDHGEGGTIIGRQPQAGDRVVIVDDVTSTGLSIRQAAELLRSISGVVLAGAIVSVDRMERGSGELAALDELRMELEIPIFAIVTMAEVVSRLHTQPLDGSILIDDRLHAAIKDYYRQYGPATAG